MISRKTVGDELLSDTDFTAPCSGKHWASVLKYSVTRSWKTCVFHVYIYIIILNALNNKRKRNFVQI